jgi:hypothetical protein
MPLPDDIGADARPSSLTPAPGITVSAIRPTPKYSPRPADIDPPSKDQRYSIAISLLEYVMAANEKAVFNGRHQNDHSGVSPYRATIFWPVKAADKKERLYPFLRAHFGGAPRDCASPHYFFKSESEHYAGAAWFYHGTPLIDFNLPTLIDGDENAETWRTAWCKRGVPERIANGIGEAVGSYLKRVRSVACISAETAYGPLVLAIESTRENGFTEDCLTAHARNRYKNVGQLLAHLPSRVKDHRDFWTWALGRFGRWRALATLLSALPGASLVLNNWFRFAAPNLAAWVSVYSRLLLPATLLILGFRSLPDKKYCWHPPSAGARIDRFISHWQHVWIFLLVGHTSVAVRLIPNLISNVPVGRIALELVASGFLLLAARSMFGCYLCLTHFPQPTDDSTGIEQAPSIPTSVNAIVFLLGGLSVFNDTPLRTCPAAAMLGVILCMLTGRLDSRIMGTPISLVVGLYIAALMYPIGCVFAQGAAPGDVQKENLAIVDVVVNIVNVSAVPLTVILFAVVTWLIHGRAIERYLLNLEKLTSMVPRRTLSEAWQKRIDASCAPSEKA